jgi:hypothetical protein
MVIAIAVILEVYLPDAVPGRYSLEAEKGFIKKVDKTAGKLDLNEDQKAKLRIKAEVRRTSKRVGKKIRKLG